MLDARVHLVEDRAGSFSRVARPEEVHVVRGTCTKGIRAPGPVLIADSATVAGDVEARGAVHLARNAIVSGSIRAMGDVIVGANAAVAGSIRAEGRVILLGNASVAGAIDAAGDATLRRGARVAELVCGGDLHVSPPVVAPKVRCRGQVMVENEG